MHHRLNNADLMLSLIDLLIIRQKGVMSALPYACAQVYMFAVFTLPDPTRRNCLFASRQTRLNWTDALNMFRIQIFRRRAVLSR